MWKFNLILLLILALVAPVNTFARHANIDSLYHELHKSRNEVSKIEIYRTLSEAYLDTDMDSAGYYAQKALSLSEVNGDKSLTADALQQMGLVSSEKNADKEALAYFQKALVLYEEAGDKDKIAGIENRMSLVCYFMNKYDESEWYARKALEVGGETNNASVRGTALFYLGNISKMKNDFDRALGYYEQSLKIRRETGNKDELASVLNNIGSYYMSRADYKNAVRYLEETLEIRRTQDSPRSTGIVLTNLGNANLELGELDKAIAHYREAISIFREIGFDAGVAADLTGMATIYDNRLNQFESALEVYSEILKIREKSNDPRELANTYSNISIVYSHILTDTLARIYGKDFDRVIYESGIKISLDPATQALKYGLMALRKRREIDDMTGVSNSLANLGNMYRLTGNYKEANTYFTEWDNLPREFKDDKSELTVTIGLGKILAIEGDFDRAVRFYNRAFDKAREMDARSYIEETANDMSQLYEKMGNYKDALKYYRIFNEVGDSTLQVETRKQIHEMQVKYETEAKERENVLLKKNQTLTEAKLKLRNKALFASVIVLLVFIAMLIQLFRQNRFRRKANHELARKNILITEQTKEITDSIHYAGKIQNAMLPPADFIQRLLPEHFIIYRPRDIVSGDFYWITEKNNKIIVLISDCTGHGVPGALMSMLGVAFLNEIVSKNDAISTNLILDELRSHVIQSLHQTGREGESQDGMDVTVYMIDRDTRELEYAGANNSLLIFRPSEMIELKADKMPIGIHKKANEPFAKKTITLQPGDMIYAFSDGYPDQFGGPKGKKFMIRNFKQLLSEVHLKSPREQGKILEETLNKWMEHTQQVDDILVMGVRV